MNTFAIGDTVDVLRACRLPRTDVIHTGTILRIDTDEDAPALYWISGLPMARTADVLRLIQCCPSCDGDGYGPGLMQNCPRCVGRGKV